MGFTFRKSISLGKGLRINMSKSGVGLSTGIKGARISLTPKGTRIYGGVGPIRYQKSFSSGSNIKYSSNTYSPSRSYSTSAPREETPVGCVYTIFVLIGLGLMTVSVELGVGFLILMGIILTLIELSPVRKSNRLMTKAHKSFGDTGYSDEGIILLQDSIKANLSNTKAKLLLAKAYYLKRDYENAIPLFEEIKEIFSDFCEIHFYLGVSYHMTKQYEKAIVEFQEVDEEEEFGEFMKTINNKGICLVMLKKYDLAVQVFKEGLRRRKQEYVEIQKEMRYNLVCAYEKLDEMKLAKKELQRLYLIDANFKDVKERISEK
ncbi:MAG: hypothetical protein A2452_11185 [Candidatus Firestonebacteria bacterium RIFOXYC2_FULL_39_67]|nr:MAG: hypothetical protein A2452_11185 [Candidatus Firestonebacteria bacterium RIFOXYC2_FULL_39_67]